MPLTDQTIVDNIDRIHWLRDNAGDDVNAAISAVFVLALDDDEFDIFCTGDISPLVRLSQRMERLGVNLY
jgi:hypothetical protein